MKIKILFLGNSQTYSQQVKTSLIKAGYSLTLSLTKADLIISASYGQKIPSKDLKQAKFGGLNLHPSLLPKYRGATPVPHALLNQDTQTGITIIKMVSQFDTGPILAQQSVTIHPNDTTPDLLNRCFKLGSKLLIKALPDYLNNKLTLTPQPFKSPTPYCYKFKKSDGYISWPVFTKSVKNNFKDIDHQIRALYPWPGVWATMPNHKTLKLLPENKLQLEGKQPISLKQFLAGYQHLL